MSRIGTKPTKWQRRFRSAQSDQSSLSAWRKLGSLATNEVHSEDSDQTRPMPRLIWVFSGRTYHFVGFVTMRLICNSNKHATMRSWWIWYLDRVKRIWYLSPMRAAKVQVSLRIRAVSPEPPLLAHTSSESRGTFRQKVRSLAPLNGWACAVKGCHDGMLEDTNSLDGAHLKFIHVCHLMLTVWHNLTKLSYEPRQENLCLLAFRHDKFKLRMPSHSEGPVIWLSVWRFLLTHCLYERAAKVLARLRGRAGSPEPSLLA